MSPTIRFRRTPVLCKASHFAQLSKCSEPSTSWLRWQNCHLLKGRSPLLLALCYQKGYAYSRCFFSTCSSDVCPILSCEVLLKCSQFYWKPTSSTKAFSNPFSSNIFSFPVRLWNITASLSLLPPCAKVTFDLSVPAEKIVSQWWAEPMSYSALHPSHKDELSILFKESI